MPHLPALSSLRERCRAVMRAGATSAITIDADRGDVYDQLIDPRTYPDWLVGAQGIRAIDDSWPAPGSAFHHRVGAGPIRVEDSTRVISAEAPDELVLEAAIGFLGSARVRFELSGSSPTEIAFQEVPSSGPLRAFGRTLGWVVVRTSIWGRNRASLERLKHLVEGRAETAEQS